MRKIIFLNIIFILLLLPLVSSFSLRKGTEVIYFEPGLTKTVTFIVDNFNGPTKSFEFVPSVQSNELHKIRDQVVYIQEPEAIINAGETKEVSVDINFPDTLEYGAHEIHINVFGKDPIRRDMIQTRVVLGFVIRIYSLYPGKRLEGRFLQPNSVNIGETINFHTRIRNVGSDDVDSAKVRIDIYQEGGLVESAYSNSLPLASKEEDEFNIPLIIADSYEIGEYTAKAVLEYDGNEHEAVPFQKFNIGALSFSILNITSRKFENNKINKFDIEVESKWNRPIDVYADIILTDLSGVEKDRLKTQTVTVEGWRKSTVPVYFDTEGIENDNYMLKVILNYGEKTSQRTFVVYVGNVGEAEIVEDMPSIPKGSLMIILLGAVVVLLVVIIVLILFLKRKKEPYNETQ